MLSCAVNESFMFVFFSFSEMARDSAVGRERVLIVPGSLQLENAANQHTGVPPNDINQQILEVSPINQTKIFFISISFFAIFFIFFFFLDFLFFFFHSFIDVEPSADSLSWLRW